MGFKVIAAERFEFPVVKFGAFVFDPFAIINIKGLIQKKANLNKYLLIVGDQMIVLGLYQWGEKVCVCVWGGHNAILSHGRLG